MDQKMRKAGSGATANTVDESLPSKLDATLSFGALARQVFSAWQLARKNNLLEVAALLQSTHLRVLVALADVDRARAKTSRDENIGYPIVDLAGGSGHAGEGGGEPATAEAECDRAAASAGIIPALSRSAAPTADKRLLRLSERHTALEAELARLNQLQRRLDDGELWTADLEEEWEEHAKPVFAELDELRYKIAACPAQSIEQLKMKAAALLAIAEQDSDDQVELLACSIASDLQRWSIR